MTASSGYRNCAAASESVGFPPLRADPTAISLQAARTTAPAMLLRAPRRAAVSLLSALRVDEGRGSGLQAR